ncbi:MAG: MotA/TolQ/ExbB proton channel family protein [Desulfovibrio sp.]|nr:MotA/TolQ/ExbB proton channel family protein [Desulfovibrio sp.]
MDSIIHAILQATLVSKAVLVLLVVMSLASWSFMIGKWFTLRAAQRRSEAALAKLDSADDLIGALRLLGEDKECPFFGIAIRGVREFNRINKTGDAEKLLNDNVRRSLRYGIEEQMAKLKSPLFLLATAANTAPFIGLFGTVWGIMYSFQAIALMKSVSLATVAPGIAEALIATAMGLFVAIPATLGYNIFRSRLSSIEGECINFAGILLNRMQHEVNRHDGGIRFADMREAA